MIRRLLPVLALAALVLRGALPAAAHIPAPAWQLASELCGTAGGTAPAAPHRGVLGEACADHCLGAPPALMPGAAAGFVRPAVAAPAPAAPSRSFPLPALPAPYRVRAPPVPEA